MDRAERVFCSADIIGIYILGAPCFLRKTLLLQPRSAYPGVRHPNSPSHQPEASPARAYSALQPSAIGTSRQNSNRHGRINSALLCQPCAERGLEWPPHRCRAFFRGKPESLVMFLCPRHGGIKAAGSWEKHARPGRDVWDNAFPPSAFRECSCADCPSREAGAIVAVIDKASVGLNRRSRRSRHDHRPPPHLTGLLLISIAFHAISLGTIRPLHFSADRGFVTAGTDPVRMCASPIE